MYNLSPLGLITCFIFSMMLNGTSFDRHSGAEPLPYITNYSKHTIYFKPESRIANPGLDPYGAYALLPGESYYLPFDAVVTATTDPGKIFRVPTGSRLVIGSDGNPAPANMIARTSLLLPAYGNVVSPCEQFAKLANPKSVLYFAPDVSPAYK